MRGVRRKTLQEFVVLIIDVKKRFLYFFYFGHVFFTFLTFFIFQTFFYLKNVDKVQSGKQINKKHFQIAAMKFNGFINNKILYPVMRM